MSEKNSLTHNYDKDSFEDGTFEDISEISLEEQDEDEENDLPEYEEEEDSDLDENYTMELEMTKIVMPKYSSNHRNSLMEDSLKEEKLKNTPKFNNSIEAISRTSDEEELTMTDDESDHDHDLLNQINNKNEDHNSEEYNSDSDDMDVEMNQLDSSLENIKKNEILNNKNTKNYEETDNEEHSDIETEDLERNTKTDNSKEKIRDDSSDQEQFDDENIKMNETSIDFEITSQKPSSYDSEDRPFHLDFIKKSQTSLKSNGQTRKKNKNLTFSNERLRDIERQNKILLQRILSKKPTYENSSAKTNNKNLQAKKITTAAINRKKQQYQIDIDNQILKRKLEAIALRRRAKP